ncbi:G-protein beta WD-40 repeats containing protein, partial [Reticulomyxa filosa]
NGQMIVSASYDKTIAIWIVHSGEMIWHLQRHSDWVQAAKFSPDGRMVVSSSWDKTIRVWDLKTGKEVLILRGHLQWVTDAQFSPDGQTIVSGSADKTIRLWDSKTGQEIQTLEGHSKGVNELGLYLSYFHSKRFFCYCCVNDAVTQVKMSKQISDGIIGSEFSFFYVNVILNKFRKGMKITFGTSYIFHFLQF